MNLDASSLFAEYRRRTPNSARLAERAASLLPSGIAHDSRRTLPYPIYVARAEGSRKWDVDGNEYVDYAGGHGALLFGHNPPEVALAVREQLEHGTHFGACHELELRWAELICQLVPSAERVRFTSSGTEATLLALRLARAFSKRPKVLRFVGHFHGWHDHAACTPDERGEARPTPGVLPEVASQIVLARPNDAEQVESLLQKHPDLGAVILEPTGASWGQAPVLPQFVRDLREMTARRDVVLIFDEVISGFRCSPGGAQQALGVTPDLTTLAKIVAGGLPGGAVVGRKDILDLLDFDVMAAAGREKVPHQGTFNANPLSAAAGIATLDRIRSSDACEHASRYAERLRTGLANVAAEAGLDWSIYGAYSGFHIFTNPEREPIDTSMIASGKVEYAALKNAAIAMAGPLRIAMLLGGVDLFAWPGGPTSAVHTDDDLHQTCEAFRSAIALLRRDGLLAAD